jgi:hypothetical protein
MAEPVKLPITKRQPPLMGENTLVIANWAGVSSTTPCLLPPALNRLLRMHATLIKTSLFSELYVIILTGGHRLNSKEMHLKSKNGGTFRAPYASLAYFGRYVPSFYF